MAIKTQRLYYTARNEKTGLSDITATVYRNAVAGDAHVATGLALNELDNVKAPGLYALILSTTQLASWGGKGTYLVVINSPTEKAKATLKVDVKENDSDDLELHLTVLETKVDDLEVATTQLQSDLTSVKSTVEDSNTVLRDPTIGNSNIVAFLNSLMSAVSTIQNNTRFYAVLPEKIAVPEMVGEVYQYGIDIRLKDETGNMEDPNADQILVSITNKDTTDRTNYLQGYTAGPVAASKIGVGKYRVMLEIPHTTPLDEQLTISFDYSEGTGVDQKDHSDVRTTTTVVEAAASGLALQATLIDVLTDTTDMKPRVQDIQTILSDATYGSAAMRALVDVVRGISQDNKDVLTHATFGNAAMKIILDTKSSQASVDALTTAIQNEVKGADFDASHDSLHKISERVYTGGTVV